MSCRERVTCNTRHSGMPHGTPKSGSVVLHATPCNTHATVLVGVLHATQYRQFTVRTRAQIESSTGRYFSYTSDGGDSVLSVNVIGNLGADPQQQYTPSGQALLRFNVAVNQRVRVDGEWQDRTEWVRVTVFGKRAETLGQYLKKGTRVFVAGRLEARPWTDQQGQVRAGLEVVASEVEFMSSRQQDGEQDGQGWRPIRQRPQPPADEDDLEGLPF